MFGTITTASGQRTSKAVSRWTRLLLAVVCVAGFSPQGAEAGPATVQVRVTATVLPRCQELNVAGRSQINAAYTCAPQSARLVRQMNELSVLSAPGSVPQVTRHADQVVVLF